MFGGRRRREEYWEGFRDALVMGAMNPMMGSDGIAAADRPGYRDGFSDGERAFDRITGTKKVTKRVKA